MCSRKLGRTREAVKMMRDVSIQAVSVTHTDIDTNSRVCVFDRMKRLHFSEDPKLLSADCACVAPCLVLHVTTVVCFPVNEGVPSPQYVQHS